METLKVNRSYTYSNLGGTDTMVIVESEPKKSKFRIVSGNNCGFSDYRDSKTLITRDTQSLLKVLKLVK